MYPQNRVGAGNAFSNCGATQRVANTGIIERTPRRNLTEAEAIPSGKTCASSYYPKQFPADRGTDVPAILATGY